MESYLKSNSVRRYWFALYPDVTRPIGGVKQAHRLVEIIKELGLLITIIQEEADFHPGWFTSNVPTIGLEEFSKIKLSYERDVIIVPETFINILDTYFPEIPKIIFNQNGSYTFGLKREVDPHDVFNRYHNPLIRHVLCVSHADFDFLTGAFKLPQDRVSRIVNSIELDLFHPVSYKRRQIIYMPRKNQSDASIVCALLKRQLWLKGWTLKPLKNLDQAQVAKEMQESLVFLSFGHPEGFGLPLAEAASSGCAIIGYSGIGGREIFAETIINGTGYEVHYGDWQGFISSLENFISSFNKDQKLIIKSLSRTAIQIRDRYSPSLMKQSIEQAISKWEPQLPSLK